MLYCFVTAFTLFMNSMYLDNNGLFQQENALCHRVQVSQNWFEKHSEDITFT